MSDILGFFGLAVALSVTAALILRRTELAAVLLVAFTIRAGVALFHCYVAPLPDGTADAITFERYAWEWAQGGLSSALGHYPGMGSYFYSWLMSLLYSVTDRSLLLLQSTSVLVGVLGVFATWRLAFELWDVQSARKAAWGMALFPIVVQYGALPMREAWVVLFFVLGLSSVVRWARNGGPMPVMTGIGAFVLASFFHGGMFVAALGFIGLIGARAGRQWMAAIARGKLRVLASLMLITVIVFFAFYIISGASIPKLGTAEAMLSFDRLSYYFESRIRGEAAYPLWLQPDSFIDFIWAVPARGLYLLFSPFPWDIRSASHLVGMVDGLLYLILASLIWKNRRSVMAEPGSRAVLLLLIPLLLAFGVGTGNFGTALRHRAKFVVGLIVLASPFLPRLVLRRRIHRRDVQTPSATS
jgi:hypothetical protein